MSKRLVFFHECVILDASCLITLYATGHFGDILAAIPATIAVATYVCENEAGYVYKERETPIKEKIELQPCIDAGRLLVVAPTDQENSTYIDFASEIDDGEAITGAIAAQRNWAIASDDRKARNFFSRHAAHLQLLSTPELFKQWVDTNNPTRDLVRTVLQDVRTRAVYAPGRHDPLYAWWQAYLQPE